MKKIKQFFKRLRFAVHRAYVWDKYRHIDPYQCCCGEDMRKPYRHLDSICQHGGCRSMKEYCIDCELNKNKRNQFLSKSDF